METGIVAVMGLIEQLAVGGEGAVAVAGRTVTVRRVRQWEFQCLDECGARRCLGGPGQVAIHLKDLLWVDQQPA